MKVANDINRKQLEKLLAGAMKSCIDAHGPITRDWTGSAAKRMIGLLKQSGAFVEQESV
jgi:hypothetical protein